MTVAEEINYLKDQIRLNQTRYARCVQEKDDIGMRYLAQNNRELIDRLNCLEDSRHSFAQISRGTQERLR